MCAKHAGIGDRFFKGSSKSPYFFDVKAFSHRPISIAILCVTASSAHAQDGSNHAQWPNHAQFAPPSIVSQQAFAGPYVRLRPAFDEIDTGALDRRLALSAGLAALAAGFAVEGYVTLISPCETYDRSVPFARTCMSGSTEPRLLRQFSAAPTLPGNAAAILGTVAAAGFATWFTVSLVERFGKRWSTSIWHLNSNHMNKPLALSRGTMSVGLNFGFGTLGVAGSF